MRVEAEAQQQVDDTSRPASRTAWGRSKRLVQALGKVPGPKTLVLASGGFTAVEHRRRHRGSASGCAASRPPPRPSRVNFYSLYFSQRSETYAASLARLREHREGQTRRRARRACETFTGLAGGALFEAVAGANFAFERVVTETSGRYLLGLEPAKRDRDGKPHDIDVKVSRKGVDVRARRQFVMPAAPRRAPRPAADGRPRRAAPFAVPRGDPRAPRRHRRPDQGPDGGAGGWILGRPLRHRGARPEGRAGRQPGRAARRRKARRCATRRR